MRRFGWLILAAAATACGSSSGSGSAGPATVDGVTLMAGFDPGPAPDPSKGFQIVLPIVNDIKAGQSYEYCSWTNMIAPEDLWVKSSDGYQTDSGHHVVIFYTQNPVPGGTTRICKDSDMASLRFATPVSGAEVNKGSAHVDESSLPGDLAILVPKGSQIVVNHHYLNATTKDLAQAQSAINVYYADPNTKITRSSPLAFVDTGMNIPPGPNAVDINCTVNQDFSTWYLLPHMHNWGQHITVDHTSGSNTERLFDLDWDPSYAFHAPTKSWDPSTPYMLKKGDTVHVHCDYNNTTSQALTFGAEMCVLFGEVVDPTMVGSLACDSGSWGPF